MKVILETICDTESERGVLGCCLVDEKKVFDVFDACGSEAVELFTDEFLRKIWAALLEVVTDGGHPDLLQLTVLLKKEESQPTDGWITLLTALQDTVPSASNLSFYLDSARDAALKRKAGRFLTEIYEKLSSSKASAKRLLEEAEAGLMQLNTQQARESLVHLPDEFAHTMEQVDQYVRGVTQMHGIPTHYKFLDRKMGGLVPGEMIVIAGRPGGGKTALGLNIAARVATGDNGNEEPVPVMFFSMEMTVRQLAARVLFSEAKANMVQFRTGYLDKMDVPKLLAAEAALKSIPMYIDDRPGLTIGQIAAKARQAKLIHNIGLIVVDYLQLARLDSKAKFQQRHEVVGEVSQGLQALAKNLDVPVIALAQLNRNAAKGKYDPPNLADLRESGQIEQDADFVGLLHEVIPRTEEDEKLTAGDDEYTKHTKLIIAKQRSGPGGEVHFKFKKGYVRFETLNFENINADGQPVLQDDMEEIPKSIFDEAATKQVWPD